MNEKSQHQERNTSAKSGVAVRQVATQALLNVYEKGAALDSALLNQSEFAELSTRDRAFARLLAATTIRRTGQIDKVLKHFLKKRPSEPTYTVLRMGSAQILFLKTPPHAAVDASINVLKANPKTRAMSGLANAVLRKVATLGPRYLADTRPVDNIPHWLRDRWHEAYGKAVVRRMAAILVSDPPLDLQLKHPTEEALKAWAKTLDATIMSDNSLRLYKPGQVSALPGFETGQWWVQDTSASLTVKLLGDIAGLRVLDMCAAPGGKTLQLAAAGAEVVALDKNAQRLELVGQNLARTGLKAQMIHADAQSWTDPQNPQGGGFDVVLLDAPCTATGTYRRHPDVLYNKSPQDVRALSQTQKSLLNTAARHVRPNGRLIYCTCSLERREGEDIVAQFAKNQSDFRLNSDLLSSPSVTRNMRDENGDIRIRPDMQADLGGMDGFFISMFTHR